MSVNKTRICTFLSVLGLCGLLAVPAGAQLYELPLCQVIEGQPWSPTRDQLFEQCDKAEQLIQDWLNDALNQGYDQTQAWRFALHYIATAHWQKLLEIQSAAAESCGNGTCAGAETYETCPMDCPYTVCGDFYCDTGEDVTCPSDCSGGYCGDFYCDTGEDVTCPSDCS